MIFTTANRQGFDKALSGVEGSSIQSAYALPAIGSSQTILENASWKYPLGDPWGWDIYPWNWGKEDEANKENPTPDQNPEAAPWKAGEETPSGNVLMFAAVVGAILLLTSKTKIFKG